LNSLGLLNFSESGWRGRILSAMKVLIPILIGLLVVGCGKKQSPNTNKGNNTPENSAKKKVGKETPSNGDDKNSTSAINEIIAGALSIRSKILHEGSPFSDYKVYRDGNNDGVCYEFILLEDPSEEDRKRMTGGTRDNLISGLKSDVDAKTAMERGIYMRYIYKSPDGRVIVDQIISSSDL
jgi:hypothetical protein